MTQPQSERSSSSEAVLVQPNDIRCLTDKSSRERLIISMRKVEGAWRIVSFYGDDVWCLIGAPTNTKVSSTKLDFSKVPASFRETTKAMMYRYMRRGSTYRRRPKSGTQARVFSEWIVFLRYVETLGISTLGGVTPLVCSTYVQASRGAGNLAGPSCTPRRGRTKPLAPGTLYKRFKAVADIFELSQYTSDPMSQHPWPDASADHLSGHTKSRQCGVAVTPLMPDEVFSTLFQHAWDQVQGADKLMDFRDQMQRIQDSKSGLNPRYVAQLKTQALRRAGLENFRQLKVRLNLVRTACYVVIASLSGCRNHEMANLHSGSYYSTQDEAGEQYWWMRSYSSKTSEGKTEWMIPDAAAVALQVLERWAEPYQALLAKEIEWHRSTNPGDVRIAEAEAHVGALFVGLSTNKSNLVRTLCGAAFNRDLWAFSKWCGLDWRLASHQFRRKFANYAARSQFGDLRYLREHFKHWSMDMTLGYALNESQEMGLYLEVQDELDDLKMGVASTWLDASESLAGGYGDGLVDWRSRDENITLFKSHSAMIRSIALSTPIRSNGHAWCTAQDNLCVGNDLEKTRCGNGCSNAVIGRRHTPFYQGLYDQLGHLENAKDIGPGGRKRVRRDLDRCATVLKALGHNVSEVQRG